jgi:hypothetical protein
MAKPFVAGMLMILAALAGVALATFSIASAIALALSGMLVLAAILLFTGAGSSRLTGIVAAAIGTAGFIYVLISPLLTLLRMGAVSAFFGLIPLVGAALLAIALALIVTWQPVRP